MAVHVISPGPRTFRDRAEAGHLLAEHVRALAGPGCVVLAIPRGGVVVGAALAADLDCDLDVVIVRKLGAPHNPELAIGSVMEGAETPYLNSGIVRGLGVPQSYIEAETRRQQAEARRRAELYRKDRPKVEIEGRVAVLTDDGVATGATMISSILGVQAARPAKTIVALPVGPPETVDEIGEMADEVVCLATPALFGAVGQFYVDFAQTTDEEVVELLQQFDQAVRRRPAAGRRPATGRPA